LDFAKSTYSKGFTGPKYSFGLEFIIFLAVNIGSRIHVIIVLFDFENFAFSEIVIFSKSCSVVIAIIIIIIGSSFFDLCLGQNAEGLLLFSG